MTRSIATFLLLAAACDDGVHCPTGTTRLGEACHVDSPDAARDGSLTGGEGGASSGASGGIPCATRCATAALSWCDGTTGQCARCTGAQQCTGPSLTATPACQASVGCVACTSEDEGACASQPDKPHCKDGGNTCVECNATRDCTTDPKRPICDGDKCRGCTTAGNECGTKICDEASGACVECTKDSRAACAVDGMGRRDVCNAETHKCEVGVKEGSAPLCGNSSGKQCVSNDHCPMGSTCVQEFLRAETYSAWYCLPMKGSELCKRPFPGEKTKPTRDGPESEVCTLNNYSTCTAHSHYRGTPCTRDADTSQGDNTKCGVPGVEDGYCLEDDSLGLRCTVGCFAAHDCPDVPGAVDTTCTGNLCTL